MNTLTMSLHHAQLLLRVMQSEQRVYVEHSEVNGGSKKESC